VYFIFGCESILEIKEDYQLTAAGGAAGSFERARSYGRALGAAPGLQPARSRQLLRRQLLAGSLLWSI